ncbi:MAG: OmpA family protein [Plesiomonas shigelloides]
MMPLQRTGSRRWWLGCVMSTLVALPMSRALADVPVLFQVREEVISRGYQMPIAGPYPAQVIPADCEQYLQHNQFDVLGVDSVHFAFNRSELNPRDQAIVRCVARVMQQSDLRVGLVGHTDSIGSAAFNQGLGMRRSQSTARSLLNNSAPTSQIGPLRSAGESEPVATNSTAAGRAQNRRVQFVIE